MEILGLFDNTLKADNMYPPHHWEQFWQRFQEHITQKAKIIFGIFIAFLKSTWYFVHLLKEDQLDSLIISQVIDSEKYSYLNAKKQLFQNNLLEWAHSFVPNTAQVCMAVLLCKFSINPRQIELENMSQNHIKNRWTVC